jgi:hypothetical protein
MGEHRLGVLVRRIHSVQRAGHHVDLGWLAARLGAPSASSAAARTSAACWPQTPWPSRPGVSVATRSRLGDIVYFQESLSEYIRGFMTADPWSHRRNNRGGWVGVDLARARLSGTVPGVTSIDDSLRAGPEFQGEQSRLWHCPTPLSPSLPPWFQSVISIQPSGAVKTGI